MVSNEIINEIDFQKKITEMPDRQLLEYVAREQYFMKLHCAKMCDTTVNHRGSLIVGASSGGIVAVIIAVGEYFIARVRGG